MSDARHMLGLGNDPDWDDGMSNYPPDWRPEPLAHDRRCQSLCTSHIVERDSDAEAACAWGHYSHDECDCADIAESDAEAEALGIVDMLERIGR